MWITQFRQKCQIEPYNFRATKFVNAKYTNYSTGLFINQSDCRITFRVNVGLGISQVYG